MLRTLLLVAAIVVPAQAGAQPTPHSDTGSSARVGASAAPTTTTFPKSEATLPTGKTENQWGPFEGRVVDADTGEGIAGAALIVFWQKAILNPVEEHMAFYDSRWAVTNADGRFTVPRRDPPLVSLGITGAYLSCVAPSYLPYEFKPRYSPAVQDARLREGPATVRLKKAPVLTGEESIKRHGEFVANNLLSVPPAKREELAREINRQRSLMGMRPILILYGELE